MCAGSIAILRGEKVFVYMGHYGGNIKIGLDTYDVNQKADIMTKEQFRNKLNLFTVQELSQLIVDLVENSGE